MQVSLALEAGAAAACAHLARRQGQGASLRRHLSAAAEDTHAQLERLAPLANRQLEPRRPADADLGPAQDGIVAVHRCTLRRLRTDEARAAFAPVLALATYRAGLLRTLKAAADPQQA